MIDHAILLGLIYFLLCLIFVIYHSSRVGRLTLLDWSVIGMGGVYGIGLSIVIGVTWAGKNPSWENWILPYTNYYTLHTFLAFILMMAMYLGWLIGGSLPFLGKRRASSSNTKNIENRLYAAMWCLLVVAFIAQWLYTLAYGGFSGVLEYSRLIRSGIFPVENKLSFLRPFGGLAFFASFGFFGLWLSKYRRPGVWLGFYLSLIFSIYVLYSWMGRMGFVIYFGTFILGLILARQPRPLVLLVCGCLILLIMLISTYYLSIYLKLKPAENLMAFLAKELSFPFVSFFGQLDYGKNLFRFFYDFLVSPVYLLPSSIWSNWVEDVSQINTTLIMGAPKGQEGVTGGIPVDLLTLGLMQVTIFGIPLVGIIYGLLLRVFQLLLNNILNFRLRAISEAYIAIKISIYGIFYAHPTHLVSGNFPLLLTIFLIWLFIKSYEFGGRRRCITKNIVVHK